MTQEFVIDRFRVQNAWDWRIAFYLFLSGASGGLLFVEILLRIFGVIEESTAVIGAWIGLGLAMLSLLVLFTHLGAGRARWRFYYAFVNPRQSWISRGAIIVTILVGLRFTFLLPEIWHGLPWGEGTIVGSSLRGAIMALALAFMAYSGLVMSWWKSIPFWNTFMLPALYVCYSFLGGVAALPIVTVIAEGRSGLADVTSVMWPLLLGLIILNALVLFVYVWKRASQDSAALESVRRLTQGSSRWSWWLGVVSAGLVIPLVIIALAAGDVIGTSVAATSILILTCLAILVGSYLLRYCVLKVGIYARFM